MSLLWADGFDHYGNNQTIQNGQYDYVGDQGQIAVGTNPAYLRTGNHYLDATGLMYGNRTIQKMIYGNHPVLGAGAAFFIPQAPPNDRFAPFFFVTNTKDQWQASLHVHPDGSLSVHRGHDDEQLATTAANTMTWGAYSYIEMKVFCHPTQGYIIVRLNNVVVIAVNNVNTDAFNTGSMGGVGFGMVGNIQYNPTCQAISDFVIWDDQGDVNKDFFGDIRCRTIYPNGNGLNQNWNEVGADPAFNCVNQVPPQPGTDYIEAANVNDISTFDLQDVPGNTGAIYGVMMFAMINKADAGVCGVTFGVASAGAADQTDVIHPGAGAAYYTKAVQKDPATGAAWTTPAVNASQAIVERVQ